MEIVEVREMVYFLAVRDFLWDGKAEWVLADIKVRSL